MNAKTRTPALRRSGAALAAGLMMATMGGTASVADEEARSAFKVCADPHYLPWSNERGEGYENRIASLLAGELGLPVEYTWFPQRMGFIRNTLRAKGDDGEYKCDVVMGLPAGYELAITTDPYYHSTYALVYVKGRGLDDIGSPADLLALDPAHRDRIRFGLAERNPGTVWLAKHGLLDLLQVAYASQHGDPEVQPGQLEREDLLAGNIDVTIMWGPIAGYFARQQPRHSDRGDPDGFGTRGAPALRNLGRRAFRAGRAEEGAAGPAREKCGHHRSHTP